MATGQLHEGRTRVVRRLYVHEQHAAGGREPTAAARARAAPAPSRQVVLVLVRLWRVSGVRERVRVHEQQWWGEAAVPPADIARLPREHAHVPAPPARAAPPPPPPSRVAAASVESTAVQRHSPTACDDPVGLADAPIPPVRPAAVPSVLVRHVRDAAVPRHVQPSGRAREPSASQQQQRPWHAVVQYGDVDVRVVAAVPEPVDGRCAAFCRDWRDDPRVPSDDAHELGRERRV